MLFVFGTRPEAIKLAPVVRSLREQPENFETRVAVTAQHRDMLDQVLDAFSIRPDHDLNLMQPGQSLFQSTSRIVAALESILEIEQPGCVIVQGDTTTTFAAALAAFYQRIPSAHVEAGLRTGDMSQPFPEEMNRVLVSRLAALHFAPTPAAAENLKREGVDASKIFVTGNTAIDAVVDVAARFPPARAATPKKLILVTAHRRESFGAGFDSICAALRRLAERNDVEIVYPVHPNPNVRAPVQKYLSGAPNIHLTEPLGYLDFVGFMSRAHMILTDSGGIQEEAPSLGKPVLVMRDKTERPEAVEAGTSRLVGTSTQKIMEEAERLLDDPEEYARRSRIHNPYGDGRASERIRGILLLHACK